VQTPGGFARTTLDGLGRALTAAIAAALGCLVRGATLATKKPHRGHRTILEPSSTRRAGAISGRSWKRPFDDPIPLPRGRRLVTLEVIWPAVKGRPFKTERPQSANLLQMPKGLVYKLRQRGRGYGGPAESHGIDPSLQPPPAVAASPLRKNWQSLLPPHRCPKEGNRWSRGITICTGPVTAEFRDQSRARLRAQPASTWEPRRLCPGRSTPGGRSGPTIKPHAPHSIPHNDGAHGVLGVKRR
jgi:hypothetical protein